MGKRITELSIGDVVYLCRAVAELGLARAIHLSRPTAAIIYELQSSAVSNSRNGVGRSVDIQRIRWAISAVAARVPWRSDCLLQVMAADRWLRSRGCRGEFHLGVARPDGDEFRAHAWLTCGGVVVAGRSGEGYDTLIAPEGSTRTSG